MMERSCGDPETVAEDPIVRIARSWIGTPYRHQASCRSAGTDCLGLLRGIWRHFYGKEPERVPPYTPEWGEVDCSEQLLDAARRHLAAIELCEARPGDVLVLRMRDRGPAKHLGILAASGDGRPTLIHAYTGFGVVESPLSQAWRRKVAAAFRFPSRS